MLRVLLALAFSTPALAFEIEYPHRCTCVELDDKSCALSWDYDGAAPYFIDSAQLPDKPKGPCDVGGPKSVCRQLLRLHEDRESQKKEPTTKFCGKPVYLPERGPACGKPPLVSLDYVRNEFASGYPEESPAVWRGYSVTARAVDECTPEATSDRVKAAVERHKTKCGSCRGLTVVVNSHGIPLDKELSGHRLDCAKKLKLGTKALFESLAKTLRELACADAVVVMDVCYAGAAAKDLPKDFPAVFLPVAPADCMAPGTQSNFSSKLDDVCRFCRSDRAAPSVTVEEFNSCRKKQIACDQIKKGKEWDTIELPDGSPIANKCYHGWPLSPIVAGGSPKTPLFYCGKALPAGAPEVLPMPKPVHVK